jgi:hypothetical protein
MDQWSAFWIVGGTVFWIYGFITVGRKRKTGFLVDESFVHPPFIIYLICGMPKAKNIPASVMAIPSLSSQLGGWVWIISGLLYIFTRDVFLQAWPFCIGTFLVVAYALVLFNRNLYRGE